MIPVIIPIVVTILMIALMLSPVDLIPDVIPVLGLVDDFMLYPSIIAIIWVLYLTQTTFSVLFSAFTDEPMLAAVAVGIILMITLFIRKNKTVGGY